MHKQPINQKGFAVLAVVVVILILAVVAGAGVYVYHRNHKAKVASTANTNSSGQMSKSNTPASTPKTNMHADWKTYKLASTGLMFKYPAGWTVPNAGEDQSSIEVHSPVKDGYYFALSLMSGTEQDVNQNFLGNGPGTTLSNLDVPGSSSPLYLVAQTAGPNGEVTGLALATTPGSPQTSFGIIDDGGSGKNDVTLSANLIPAGAGSGVNNAYSLMTYQSQADYQAVVNIFKSLTYK